MEKYLKFVKPYTCVHISITVDKETMNIKNTFITFIIYLLEKAPIDLLEKAPEETQIRMNY